MEKLHIKLLILSSLYFLGSTENIPETDLQTSQYDNFQYEFAQDFYRINKDNNKIEENNSWSQTTSNTITFANISQETLTKICDDFDLIIKITDTNEKVDCNGFYHQNEPVEILLEPFENEFREKRDADDSIKEGSGDDDAVNENKKGQDTTTVNYSDQTTVIATSLNTEHSSTIISSTNKSKTIRTESTTSTTQIPKENNNKTLIQMATEQNETLIQLATGRNETINSTNKNETFVPQIVLTSPSNNTNSTKTVKEQVTKTPEMMEKPPERPEWGEEKNKTKKVQSSEAQNMSEGNRKKQKEADEPKVEQPIDSKKEKTDAIEPKTNPSTAKISKDTSILVVLFIAVMVIGGAAFAYNFIKKKQNDSNDIETGNAGVASALRRSLQSLTKPEQVEQEMKPLINHGEKPKEQEMIEIKRKNKENGDVTEENESAKQDLTNKT